MTISGIIYPKCLKNEKDIKITKVGLAAEAAELEDAEAVEVDVLKGAEATEVNDLKGAEATEVNDLKDTAAVSNAAIDEKQYIAIGR